MSGSLICIPDPTASPHSYSPTALQPYSVERHPDPKWTGLVGGQPNTDSTPNPDWIGLVRGQPDPGCNLCVLLDLFDTDAILSFLSPVTSLGRVWPFVNAPHDHDHTR